MYYFGWIESFIFMNRKLKVLITGDKGFIASHLKRKLFEVYPSIQVFGFEEQEYLDDSYKILERIKFDCIFHLAAIARTVDCTEDPFHRSFKSNIQLTNDILKNFNFNKIVFASSCAIYGNQREENFPISETNPLNPPSIYAAQKLYSENLIHFYCQYKNIPSVCLRLFNTYGPGQSQLGAYPNVIASLLKTFCEKGFVEITGDGNQTRDFVYVEDVVEAFISAMRCGYGNFIYNVCSGIETSINDIASYITDKIHYIPKRQFDIEKQVASYSTINQELAWFPKTSLSEGMLKTIGNL